MRRPRKLLQLLTLVAALAVLAAACGADDSGDADADADADVAGDAAADAAVADTANSAIGSDGEPNVDESDTDEAATGSSGSAGDSSSDGPVQPEPPADGVLVWVHEQEPPDLHVDDPKNGLDVTTWIRAAVIEGLFGIDSNTAYYPELLAGEPRLNENDDGTVRIDYSLRDGLTWSDGEPLTAADVEYTHNIYVEGCTTEADGSIINGSADGCIYLLGNRTGYDLVTDFQVRNDTDFTVTLANFSPGWKELYREVYAAHAFGVDAAAVNQRLQDFSGLPSSGPMVVGRWDRGVALNLVRNENYHGSRSPDATNEGLPSVDGVQIQFVPDTESQIDAMLGDQAHIIMTKPRLNFERLVEASNFTVASRAGTVFEHWGLNLLNPHLAKPAVREAVAYALDKSEVVEQLYVPLYGQVVTPEGLGNTYWLPNQTDYEDHQVAYEGNNVEAARASLEAAGYLVGADDVYVHPIDGRLRLRVGTTGGDELRQQQQILIQRQLIRAGIDLIIDNVDGGGYFSQRPFAPEALDASVSGGSEGDSTIWDITQFSWVGGPWPGGQSGAYRGRSRNNPYGHNNPDFDVRASECDATFSEAERAACYNDLDTYVTTLDNGETGLFMIPLTQKPSFFGYRSDKLSQVAVAPDVRRGGPLANVGDYQLS